MKTNLVSVSKGLLALVLLIALSACQTTSENANRNHLRPFKVNAAAVPVAKTPTAASTGNWSKEPTDLLIYPTQYKCGKGAGDYWSRHKMSSAALPIDYAAESNKMGFVSTSHHFRRGSIAVIETLYGPRPYLMIDWGSAVESRLALRKYISMYNKEQARKKKKEDRVELTAEQKNAPVFDFCEPKEQWVGPFIRAKIYTYTGTKDFDDMKHDGRFALLASAKTEAAKHVSGSRMVAKR